MSTGEAQPVTWEELAVRVPELDNLRREVEALRLAGGLRDDATWFLPVVGRLRRLVGWTAETADPVVRTDRAYRVAEERLLGAWEHGSWMSAPCAARLHEWDWTAALVGPRGAI